MKYFICILILSLTLSSCAFSTPSRYRNYFRDLVVESSTKEDVCKNLKENKDLDGLISMRKALNKINLHI